MMDINIEECRLEDLDQIVTLKIKMFQDANLLHLLKEHCSEDIKSKYTQLYSEELAKHFVIKVESQIVAMSGVFIKNDIPYCFYKNNKYGFIGDMYTIPEFRNKGFAQKLLTRSIEWLKSEGISSIQLLASSQGKHLYKRNGFVERPEFMVLELM